MVPSNSPIQTPQIDYLWIPLTFLFSDLRESIQGVAVRCGAHPSRHAMGRMTLPTPPRDDGNAKVLSYCDTGRFPGAQSFTQKKKPQACAQGFLSRMIA